MLSRMILERCFSRHSSDRRMSPYENKPETTEEQLRLSHVIKLFKTSIEFPARQQAFVLYYYIDHELLCFDLAKIDQLAF